MRFKDGYSVLIITVLMIISITVTGCLWIPGGRNQSASRADSDHLNWPIFRGDAALSGVSKAVLPDDPQLLWVFKAGGRINSSPIIADGRVYAGSSDGRVYALNLKDGAKQWEFNTGAPVEAAPLFNDHLIFIGSTDGVFYALTAANGKEKWRFQTGDSIFGSANTITAARKRLILIGSYDYQLYCFDQLNGKVIWKFKTQNYINGAPAVDSMKQWVVFGCCDARVHVVSALNGKEIASINAASYIAGSTALADADVYLGNYDEKVLAIDLKARQIAWKYEDQDGGPFFSSPAVGKDRVIVGARNRTLYCLNRKDGRLLWRFKAKGDFDSSPVIYNNPPAGGRVVIGGMDGRIYLINLADGAKIWSYEIGVPIKGTPAVIDNRLVVAASDGRIYAFGKKTFKGRLN